MSVKQPTEVILQLVRERLSTRETWLTALIVGSAINGYGQLLVPWLRGADPIPAFVNEFTANPGVSLLTIAAGYAFPVLVGVYASVSSRYAHRHEASRALFPDHKPDPVFRVDIGGEIVEAGDATHDLFRAHTIQRAPDILGADVWEAVVTATRAGGVLDDGTVVHFEPADQWYLVAHSPAPDGQINIYLTGVTREVATRVPGGLHA
jgi:hypothetical protein